MNTGIIDYGAGNLRSLQFALERLGAAAFVSADPARLRTADRLIFPGVGAAGYAMDRLRSTGLADFIPTYQRPLLGICLGMQLLCRVSEEQQTVGLGIFDGDVSRFAGPEKVPHTGWNTISGLDAPIFRGVAEGAFVYFVHSYRVAESRCSIAITQYGGTFSAALAYDNYYGVQFHPEKSGAVGARILHNFLSI